MTEEELKQRAEENFKKKPLGYESKPKLDIYTDGYIDGATENAPKWHKIFVDSEPYNYEYWEYPQETLPKNGNYYFVKLKNGFIKICELKYDPWSKKKYFYDLHGGKQSDVAEWLEYPDIQDVKE